MYYYLKYIAIMTLFDQQNILIRKMIEQNSIIKYF